MRKNYIALLIVLLAIGNISRTSAQSAFPYKPAHYWIDLPNSSEIYDDQVLQLIGKTGEFLVMHVNVNEQDTAFDLRSIVRRSHLLNPSLPLLMYTYTTIDDTVGGPSQFLPDHILVGYKNLGPLLLHNASNNIIYGSGPGGTVTYLGDVRKPAYRQWIVDHVADSMVALGLDGVVSDNFHPAAHVAVPQLCSNGTEAFCTQYEDGTDSLIVKLKAAIAPKPFIFNGLLNLTPYSDQQLQAMPLCDGATVEFFGYSHYSGDSSFTNQVLPFLAQIKAHPDYHIFVNGRAIGGKYQDYLTDYTWQRYLYGSYLLVKDTNTAFHYFADFAIPNGLGGRATPLDYYDDSNIPIGSPTDSFNTISGVFYRHYTNGLVLVVPNDAGAPPYSYTLTGNYYTPEGQVMTGMQTINPGSALVLLKTPPPPRPHVVKDFETTPESTSTWENASIGVENGNHFLHVGALPTRGRHLHDLMLDWNKSEKNFHKMQFRVRGTDNTAMINIVADVDDILKQNQQVVFSLPLDGTTPAIKTDTLPLFRVFRAPGGPQSDQQQLATYLPFNTSVNADGQWHTVVINGDSLLKGTGYTFRRFVFARLAGALDIDQVMLPDSLTAAGINNISSTTTDWSIYPNPAKNTVNVVLGATGDDNIELDLYDISGKKLQSIDAPKSFANDQIVQMNTAGISAGLYFVALRRNGIVVDSKKLSVMK